MTVNYSHLPPKNIDHEHPWYSLCVDLIGPYKATDATDREYTLHAMTMIDPSTGWFEVAEIDNKTADHIGKNLDYIWFSRYPRPVQCIFDNENEFLRKDFQEMLQSYGIMPKPTMVKNPQANLVERVH